MIGSGISSASRAGVAEHQALVAGAARVDAHGDVGDCSWIDEMTAQVSESKPYLARV
jgi:hypothetical protein